MRGYRSDRGRIDDAESPMPTDNEFVEMICGDIMTVPGPPRQPSAAGMELADDGRVVGLFL
jgi:formyltetrahydrofolate synthetase